MSISTGLLILNDLHWLPVKKRILFKLLIMGYSISVIKELLLNTYYSRFLYC